MSHPRPTEADLLDHARHDEDFLDFLLAEVLPTNSRFADWALVAAFYSALHFTKAAILRDHNRHVTQHVGRTDHLGSFHAGHNDLVNDYLGIIKTTYRDMFDLGHEARYRGYYKLAGNATAEVQRKRKDLDKIKSACGY